MRFLTLLAAALYVALAGLPSPAMAGIEDARAVAAEKLPKLVFVEPYRPAATGYVADIEAGGALGDLSDYAGAPVVLNFWATWCGPCRHEMPGLQRLDSARDGELDVVTIAFGRHNPVAVRKFWDEAGITTLPLHQDASGDLARAFGVRGLPHTVILDGEGMVVAELRGEAEWDGEAVSAVLDALLGK